MSIAIKAKVTAPLAAALLVLAGCTAAQRPAAEVEQTPTSTPTPTADQLTVESEHISVYDLSEIPGFWETETTPEDSITLTGVRAPAQLQGPVEKWTKKQVDAFAPEEDAALTTTAGICGASGTMLCYAISANGIHYRAWIADSKDGSALNSLKILSDAGISELKSRVTAEPTAVFPNPDGSLTVVADSKGYRVSGPVESLLSPKGEKIRGQMMKGEDPEPIPRPEPNCEKNPCIALTFDDGPGPYTDQLLDTLKEKNAKATFFLIGRNAANNPDLVKREADEGHEVGNHTWSHLDLSQQTQTTITNQIVATDQAIQSAGAPAPLLVRPPYGATNATVRSVIASRGQTQILWSLDTLDWKNRDVKKDIEIATEKAEPGAIVLMHDIHPETVKAVPTIIDELQLAGYDLVTVSEL